MKISKSLRVIFALTVAVALICANALTALACTGFYFGSETTARGTSIWGRTEDISANYSKLFYVHPAQEHEPGSEYISSSGFSTKHLLYSRKSVTISRGMTSPFFNYSKCKDVN